MLLATTAFNPLLVLSLILVAGVAAGEIAKRLRLPSVTGQIVAGILLGPAVIGAFGADDVHTMKPILEFALGLMAVTVGSHLRVRRLANAMRRLGFLLVGEALVTPTIVFGLLYGVAGASWAFSLLLATISISTAPATILALVKETHARGVFVKTLIAAVALNNLACIVLFEIAHSIARTALSAAPDEGIGAIAFTPLRQLAGSMLLGGLAGAVLVKLTRKMPRSDRVAACSLVAILLVAGLSDQLQVSTLLSCLVFGATLANLTHSREEIGHAVFANFEYAIFAIFFTLAGMELRFELLVPGGALALLVFVGRATGKLVAGAVGMRLGGATPRMRRYLGMALIPQAGLAVGLMLHITEDPAFAAIHDLVLAVVLSVVLLNEIVGPILTRMALVRTGEAGKDRPRVLDFIHEEHIVTGLNAATVEEATERLIRHLARTRKLNVPPGELLERVLDHERAGPSCLLGDGLAIQFGLLDPGSLMVGAMGLSSEGLHLPTPDGKPVHCMVLLCTAPEARDRHQLVLAELVRAIHAVHTVHDALYHAESPTHAYEILHADEATDDYNYFLDDDAE